MTSDCYRVDVRWLERKGLLLPGRYSTLTWSRNGELIGKISLRSEIDRVILSYRHRRYDEPWNYEEYPITLEWTRCHYGWFTAVVFVSGNRLPAPSRRAVRRRHLRVSAVS